MISLVNDSEDDNQQSTLTMMPSTPAFLLSVLLLSNNMFNSIDYHRKGNNRAGPIYRQRRDVSDIFYELGKSYVRRAYRMTAQTFWELEKMLRPCTSNNEVIKRGSPPNGEIEFSLRLSMAIRYFAGASPYDIALVHGVAHSDVFNSIWLIVDLVNTSTDFTIEFPTDHNIQKEIALGFKAKSGVEFDNCVGAIDGMLIWIHKPSIHDTQRVKCGAKKFFCGRKKKFGLNMQACCDSAGKFLDISICHPGATSDYLSFQTINLTS
jgi:DDE superfamily endonuclease